MSTEPMNVNLTFLGQPLAFRYEGRLTPAGNRKLTDDQYRRACELADRIDALAHLGSGVASGLARGANAWTAGSEPLWHPLFGKDRAAFDHLRLFCQPFTGYDPISEQTTSVPGRNVPSDLEARLAERTSLSAQMLELLVDQRKLPDHARVVLPPCFGEIGALCDGTLTNYDAWSLQMQMNGLHGAGVLPWLRARAMSGKRTTVVDIGSGFGGLLHQLGRTLPGENVRLVAIDLPESLLFAAVYLSVLWEERPAYLSVPGGFLSMATGSAVERLPDTSSIVFVVAALAEEALHGLRPVDLVLNFRSMQEMSDEQVAAYATLARETLAEDGILYEQNDRVRAVDRDVKAILGSVMAYGGVLDETDPPHRGMGPASLWSNRPIDLSPSMTGV